MALTIKGKAMYVVRRLDLDTAKYAIAQKLRKHCGVVEVDRIGDILWRARSIRRFLSLSRLHGTSGRLSFKPKSYGGASIDFEIDIGFRLAVYAGVVIGLIVLWTTTDRLSLPIVISLAFVYTFGLVNEMRRLKIWLRDEIGKALKELDSHAVVV